jgi:hypothetical protein
MGVMPAAILLGDDDCWSDPEQRSIVLLGRLCCSLYEPAGPKMFGLWWVVRRAIRGNSQDRGRGICDPAKSKESMLLLVEAGPLACIRPARLVDAHGASGRVGGIGAALRLELHMRVAWLA